MWKDPFSAHSARLASKLILLAYSNLATEMRGALTDEN